MSETDNYINFDYINFNYISFDREARLETTLGDRLKYLAAINDDLAEIVASNISAPPELLKELAKHDIKAIRKAVASNPNTPTEILLKLGEYFPQELLDNHVFELLMLEDSKFLESIPKRTVNALIQRSKVPQLLLERALNYHDKDIRETANMQVSVSGEMREGWHEIAEKAILCCSLLNKFILEFPEIVLESESINRLMINFYPIKQEDLPNESFKLLTKFYKFLQFDFFKSEMFKFFIVGIYDIEPSILKQLVSDEDKNVRGGIAQNHGAPAEILELLVDDPDSSVRIGIAGNINTPIAGLKSLASDRELEVRRWVAKNWNTPPEILKSLLNNRNSSVNQGNFLVFEAVARNWNTPPEILESLLNDRYNLADYYNRTIVEAVARNPSTPPETLKSLAADLEKQISKYESKNFDNLSLEEKTEILRTTSHKYYKRIIRNIAKNPSTPIEVLNSFTSNIESYVWEEVAGNPNASADILKYLAAIKYKSAHYNETFHCNVARNPNTPVKILEAYANSSNIPIRESVANNPNAPVKLLEFLAVDRDDRMRFCVARNSNTPINLLESLANDSSIRVRSASAKNPNTPLETLEKLANDVDLLVRESVSDNPQCTWAMKETIFKNFAKSDIPSLSRVALFLSDRAESSVLAKNSGSISWLERYAIACNPKTPKDTLQQLAQDGNRIVRATAKESLERY